MNSSTVGTLIILAMIFLILSSLGFGLFYLLFNQHSGKQTLQALSIRIGLSMTLFLGLLIAIYFGWVIPEPPPL
jgi:Trk-type K+ transport system membrane component